MNGLQVTLLLLSSGLFVLLGVLFSLDSFTGADCSGSGPRPSHRGRNVALVILLVLYAASIYVILTAPVLQLDVSAFPGGSALGPDMTMPLGEVSTSSEQ